MSHGERAGVGGVSEADGRRRDHGVPRHRARGRRAGQALSEFALIALLLLLLLTATFELSRHFYTRLTVRHSVAEAARFAATGRTLEDPESGEEMTRAESIVQVILRSAERLPVQVEDILLDPADGGRPGDLVRIQARFRFFFAVAPLIQSFAPTSIAFTVATTVRNEPRF